MRKAAATRGIKRQQVYKFLSQSETYTKFRAGINKFTRLKVQSYRINEIGSGDLADVHQLAKKQRRRKVSLGFRGLFEQIPPRGTN